MARYRRSEYDESDPEDDQERLLFENICSVCDFCNQTGILAFVCTHDPKPSGLRKDSRVSEDGWCEFFQEKRK